MEHHTSSTITPERPLRIPRAIWVIGAGLVAALLAIFVFKVAVGTVFTFSLFGLMAFSHLFMHGGHGSDSGHGDSPPRRAGRMPMLISKTSAAVIPGVAISVQLLAHAVVRSRLPAAPVATNRFCPGPPWPGLAGGTSRPGRPDLLPTWPARPPGA